MAGRLRAARRPVDVLEVERGGVKLEEAASAVTPFASSRDLAFQAVHRAVRPLKELDVVGNDAERLLARDRLVEGTFRGKERFLLGELAPVADDVLARALRELRAGRPQPLERIICHTLGLLHEGDRESLAAALHLDAERLTPLLDSLVREGAVEESGGALRLRHHDGPSGPAR